MDLGYATAFAWSPESPDGNYFVVNDINGLRIFSKDRNEYKFLSKENFPEEIGYAEDIGWSSGRIILGEIIDNTPPSKVTGLIAYDIPDDSGGSIGLEWNLNFEDVAHYLVYRSSTESFTDARRMEKRGETNADVNYFIDFPTIDGTKYYYAVAAIDESGNENTSVDCLGPVQSVDNIVDEISSRGGGGGCFIATATYGTPNTYEVKLLSQFRDKYLLTNHLGKTLVKTYYKTSPTIANYIEDKEGIKEIAKNLLKPIVYIVKEKAN